MDKKKVLLFGPFSPPITGQSVAFKTLVNSYSKSDYRLVDTTRFNSSFLNSVYSIFLSLYFLFFDKSIRVVFFTCSRSKLGAIKDIPLLLVGGFLEKRIINHLHGADFASFYEKSGSLKPILRTGYQNVHTSIVLTAAMAREFEEFEGMKTEVVHNFYSDELEKNPVKNGHAIKVTFMSNLLFSKGVMDFLVAAKIVLSKNPNIEFALAGEFMGDDFMSKQEIKEKVTGFLSLNKGLNIYFKGAIDLSERFDFLQDSDIFVLPTFYPTEAVPLTIIEAMRCGNVIITTEHNYLPHVFSNENGSIITPGKVNEIADAIMKYCNDPNIMRSIQEFNMVEAKAKYSQSVYISSLQAIIKFD